MELLDQKQWKASEKNKICQRGNIFYARESKAEMWKKWKGVYFKPNLSEIWCYLYAEKGNFYYETKDETHWGW